MHNYSQVKAAIRQYITLNEQHTPRDIKIFLESKGLRATPVEISLIIQELREEERRRR